MRRYFRKIITFVMSGAMIAGIFVSAAAEEGGQNTATGSGQIEGIVQPYVYQVVLPTYVDGCFDFIMDPQRLIEETNGAAYEGLSFEKGATVFFRRTDGRAEEDYSSSSDHMCIINRSNVPVDVLVNVSISEESLGNITMTGDRTFAQDAGASLYIALTDGENTVPVEAGEACIKATLPAAPEEAFEYVYDQEQDGYTFGLKKDLNGIQFPEYSFQLSGAVNGSGEWASAGKATPLITVTWKVIPGTNVNADEKNEPDQATGSTEDDTLSQDTESEETESGDEKDMTPEAGSLTGENPDQEIELPSGESTVPEDGNAAGGSESQEEGDNIDTSVEPSESAEPGSAD